MTCNLVNHERELADAFDNVCDTPGEWVIFEYDGNSNIIKPGPSGNDGIDELLHSFDTTKVQYGLTALETTDGKQRKVLLVHWQGEVVPAVRLAHTAAHVEEVRRFVKRVNCTVYARNEEDLELSVIRQKLNLTGGMAAPSPAQKPAPFIPPAPVGSVYKPAREELSLSEREKFWHAMRTEEEQRKCEEIQRRDEIQKQWQLERKLFEKELHDVHISAAVRAAQQKAAVEPPPPPAAKPPKKVSLVSGRAQMFDERAAELARSSPNTPKRPKAFKFEVAVASANPPSPVNSGQYMGGDDFVPIIEDPARPIAKVVPQAVKSSHIDADEHTAADDDESMQKMPPPSSAMNEKMKGEKRAITLWDYQADDNTEISFDANCIIGDVETLYDGWWRGKLSSGAIGLFPSNFVKLL